MAKKKAKKKVRKAKKRTKTIKKSKLKKLKSKFRFERRKFAPLKASFLFVSMVGFVFSVLIVKKWSETWAFAFALFFVIMFIASLLTIRYHTRDSQLAPRVKKGKH